MSAWQDIATAPKDGTPIDAYGVHTSGIRTRIPYVFWDVSLPMWWSSYAGGSDNAGCKRGGYIHESWTLTHWMPLHEPPAVAT